MKAAHVGVRACLLTSAAARCIGTTYSLWEVVARCAWKAARSKGTAFLMMREEVLVVKRLGEVVKKR